MDIPSQKKRLRDAIAERLQRLSTKDRDAESRSVCRRLLERLPKDTFSIAVYFPMRSEVDIKPLITELIARGCQVYMPRGEGKGFVFRRVTSIEALVPGPFGILEPTEQEEKLDRTTLDFVLVPGVAFDRKCNRIGRGSGGYDNWLIKLRKENPSAKAWGVALECQIMNEIPLEPHDQVLDAVLTSREAFAAA